MFLKPFQADINNNAIQKDMQPSTSKDGHSDRPKDNDDTLTDEDQLSQGSPWQSAVSSSQSSGTKFQQIHGLPLLHSKNILIKINSPLLETTPETRKAKEKEMNRAVKRSYGESLTAVTAG